jgi:hypothetical protein
LIWRRVKAAVVRTRIRRLERQLEELEQCNQRLDTAYGKLRETRTLTDRNDRRKKPETR